MSDQHVRTAAVENTKYGDDPYSRLSLDTDSASLKILVKTETAQSVLTSNDGHLKAAMSIK